MATKRETLGERTAEELIAYIRGEGLRPGDRLPTERALMAMLGVGRNTMREALRALVSRNILEIRQGAGTFVAQRPGVADDPLGFQFVIDRRKLTGDLLEIRLMIEPPIAALAAQNATPEEIAALELCRDAVEARIAAGEDFTLADQRFHTQLSRCSHNQVVSNLIPIINQGVSVFSAENPQECELTRVTHRRITEAVRAHRAADAQQAMLYHLLYNESRYRQINPSESEARTNEPNL